MMNEIIAWIILAICIAGLTYSVVQATKTDPVILELEYLRASEIMDKKLRLERKAEHLKKAQHRTAASIKRSCVKKHFEKRNREGDLK